MEMYFWDREDSARRSRRGSRKRRGEWGTRDRGDNKRGCMSTHDLLTLNELREQKLLCDAVIRLDDGTKLQVHRAILSATSSYFRSLFTTALHSKEVVDILIPDVSSNAMKAILEFIYCGRTYLCRDNLCQVVITANYLCIDELQELCCDFIRSRVGVENCIGTMLFARTFAFRHLETYAYNFILRNFVYVAARNKELPQLTMEDFSLIIRNDLLNVKSEEVVWECVLRWVSVDPNERKNCLAYLLKHIRLGLLDAHYFFEKVKVHKYVEGDESCRPIITEAFRFLFNLESSAQVSEVSTPAMTRPRVPHDILFAIGGWSAGSFTSYIESYDTRADRWVKVKEVDPTGPRAYHGTAVLGHNIYVIGGFDGSEYFSSCRCFSAVKKTWMEVAPMNSRRCYLSVVVLHDVIYALGGYDGRQPQRSAERYSHRRNQWTLIAPMRKRRSDADATVLNGKIYITGGFNGRECMNSVEVYSPVANQWTLLSPMRSRRSGVSCIAFHDSIYVVGGFDGIYTMNSGEKYNPTNDQWTPIPGMYNPRSNFAVEVIDGLLFAIGGFDGVATTAHVECFDLKLSEWFKATDMNIFRSALSACVVRNLPNLSDYIYQHRDQLMEEKRLIAKERFLEEMAAPDVDGGIHGWGLVDARAQNLQNAIREADAAENEDLMMGMPIEQIWRQFQQDHGNQMAGMFMAREGVDRQRMELMEANGGDAFELALDDDEERIV